MSDKGRNAAHEPQDEEYEYRQNDPEDYPTEIAGPGGRTTNIENNERGVLDAVVFRNMEMHRAATLGSNHSSHRQGIYKMQGDKYRD